jgi:hypothetical protein
MAALPFVRVGDDQLDAPQTALDQAAQERRPDGLGLAGSYVQPHDLPLALAVHGHSGYGGHADDPAALALFEVGGIQPKIRPVARQWPVQESMHPVVDVLAQLGNRALADAAQAHGLHQVIHLAGGHATNPGFLDHSHQGLLRGLARLQEGREVAALP